MAVFPHSLHRGLPILRQTDGEEFSLGDISFSVGVLISTVDGVVQNCMFTSPWRDPFDRLRQRLAEALTPNLMSSLPPSPSSPPSLPPLPPPPSPPLGIAQRSRSVVGVFAEVNLEPELEVFSWFAISNTKIRVEFSNPNVIVLDIRSPEIFDHISVTYTTLIQHFGAFRI